MKPTSGFDPGEVYTRLNLVMQDVGAVRKDQKNQAQGFKFRGIDDVVNAVYPALVKHGLVCIPSVMEHDYETVTVGSKGTQMGRVSMLVSYRIFAPDGSSVSGEVRAEAMDSGDKATAKCMSVAYRTFLLQTLCLPTDEPDPDHDVYERANPSQPRFAGTDARPAQPSRDRPAQTSAKAPSLPMDTAPKVGLTKTQQTWVVKQCAALAGEGKTMEVVSEILKREITDLSQIREDEVRVLLPGLSNKDKR